MKILFHERFVAYYNVYVFSGVNYMLMLLKLKTTIICNNLYYIMDD